jgi:hypothetical protein
MLATIRSPFFHYTPLRTKYPDSARAVATAQRLTAEKTSENYRRREFCPTAGEVGVAQRREKKSSPNASALVDLSMSFDI